MLLRGTLGICVSTFSRVGFSGSFLFVGLLFPRRVACLRLKSFIVSLGQLAPALLWTTTSSEIGIAFSRVNAAFLLFSVFSASRIRFCFFLRGYDRVFLYGVSNYRVVVGRYGAFICGVPGLLLTRLLGLLRFYARRAGYG